MVKKKNFKNITLDELAEMMEAGFRSAQREFAGMATREDLEGLRTEMNAGFAHLNITLDKHMGDVRKQTDGLAHRVKRLEDKVFGAGQ